MIHVLHLGLIDYGPAQELQRTLLELRKQDRIGDVLLLLEHSPVITMGRNAEERNLVASREQLTQRGVEFYECDRGGDVTFHGPGQLVAYPIFDLRQFQPKLGAVDFVRRLEEVLIRTCADFGIPAVRVPGLTGVWTLEGQPRPQAKIAAIGVHISRSVTTHGFALNVTTNLDYFQLIVPCGIVDKPVTSIAKETGKEYTMQQVLPVVTRNFGQVFGKQILWLESLEDLLPPPQDTPAREPEELRRLHGEDVHLA